jgi:hypothetical protein
VSNYELYKLVKRGDPSKYYGFPPDSIISILNVAPTDDQAHVVFDMIHNMAMQCPFLKNRSVNRTQSYFNIQTDVDVAKIGKKVATLQSLAGGCSSNGLRGKNSIIVIMDEMAFFIDKENSRFSGDEVYNALLPSTASFVPVGSNQEHSDGKVILSSSPYAKYGKFYDRYNGSFQEEETVLMFQMYTSLVNPRVPASFLKAERKKDRITFGCEFGGDFSDSVVAWIDDEYEFRKCISDRPKPAKGEPGISYFMGIDLGLKNDGTGIAIVHKDEQTNKIILDYASVWFSGSSDVWDIEKNNIYLDGDCNKFAHNDVLRIGDIVDEIKELSKWFPIKKGWFDQHNGYGLQERLNEAKLTQFEMENVTDVLNSKIYDLAKSLYTDQLVDMFDHPILVPEMLSLEGSLKGKNKIMVNAPNKNGAHDDISDAFVRAVWCCHNGVEDRKRNVTALSGGSGSAPLTQNAFRLKQAKLHGSNPKNPVSRKRSAGAVRMPKNGLGK